MKIAVSTLIHPRLEFPFFEEWANHLQSLNIDKIFLCLDISNIDQIWKKKNNPKYYHLEKSKDEILSIWDSMLKKINMDVRVFNLNLTNQEQPDKQFKLIEKTNSQAILENIDLICFIDVDEFPIVENLKDYINENKADRFYLKQIMFDSRWNYNQDFKPRLCKDINQFNLKTIHLGKCIYNPRKYKESINVHNINVHNIKVDGTYLTAKPLDFIIHHFRGVENGFCEPITQIKNFPNITNNPLKQINIKMI